MFKFKSTKEDLCQLPRYSSHKPNITDSKAAKQATKGEKQYKVTSPESSFLQVLMNCIVKSTLRCCAVLKTLWYMANQTVPNIDVCKLWQVYTSNFQSLFSTTRHYYTAYEAIKWTMGSKTLQPIALRPKFWYQFLGHQYYFRLIQCTLVPSSFTRLLVYTYLQKFNMLLTISTTGGACVIVSLVV